MDADGPEAGKEAVEEDDVDGKRYEIATGEDWHCLNEGIQGVKSKASERSDCFGLVMDEMQVSVYLGVVQQPMKPVRQKLVVYDVNEQVEGKERRELEGVLHLREVRIPDFDEVDQRCLPEDVQGRPLQIMQVALLLKLQLLLTRSELPFEQHVEQQVREAAEREVQAHRQHQSHSAAREVLVHDWPLGSEGLPIADQHPRVAEVRPGCG